jgi:hypothetical protein
MNESLVKVLKLIIAINFEILSPLVIIFVSLLSVKLSKFSYQFELYQIGMNCKIIIDSCFLYY